MAGGCKEDRVKIEVHILSHDHEQMIGWCLRHYRSWGAQDQVRIVVHDGGPALVQKPVCDAYQAEVKFWDTAGELNDELARILKNTCWKGTDAEWVIVVDADELLYFPGGVWETLATYDRIGAAVPKPQGFEMFSDEWHDPEHMESVSLITDWVTHGSPDDKWYSKPVLFSPKRVVESGIGIGAHESRPILKSGRSIYVSKNWPKAKPEVWLLHFHQIGPIERVAERYDATRKRLSSLNVSRRYGNFEPGLVHAQQKRDLILPHLRKVIAS